MRDFSRLLRDHGGAIATHELHAAGVYRGAIARAVSSGQLRRARQGWFVAPDTGQELFAGVRVGGITSCVSALRLAGVWTPPDTRIHVSVPTNACRLRTATNARERIADVRPDAIGDVVIHWNVAHTDVRLLADPFAALSDALTCLPPAFAFAVASSAFRQLPRVRRGWRKFVPTVSRPAQLLLSRVDGVCESGTESIFWWHFRGIGPSIARQVQIGAVGRVDFLIGERLVIEVDGREYHIDPARFEEDRRRDAELSRLGYRVLRFSYVQVMYRWPEVEAAVLAAIMRGDHNAA